MDINNDFFWSEEIVELICSLKFIKRISSKNVEIYNKLSSYEMFWGNKTVQPS